MTQTFSYDKKTGKLLNAQEATSTLKNTWSQAGQLKEEAFLHNEQSRKAKHTQTLNGAPINYTDVTGKQTQYSMDTHGRVTSITDDSLTVNLTYDALGRLHSQTVRDKASTSSLTTAFSYDSFGREITRTIMDKRGITVTLSQTWQKNGLMSERVTKKNTVELRKEHYDYDNRNRLIGYTVSGDSLPIDAYGHRMTAQTYRYDALNNLTSVKTTLADRSTNTATYSYQNANDPTQLTTLTHTHEKYPKTINLSYDAEGRMTCDEAGRTLTYDVMGRLISVSDDKTQRSGTYSYDALNRLITRNASNNDTRELYYRGAELVNEVNTSANKATRLIKTGHTCLGVSDDKGLTLTAGDKNDSLLWSEDAGTLTEGELHVWSPYGSGKPSDRLPGFNGEHADPVSGTYHLGNGYRAYNPVLMRFNCPDSLSPFGAGGINPYAYCAGDPINHTDPSGHLSWQAITGIVAGAIGFGLAAFTAGSSIAAAGGVMAALSSASASSLVIGGLGVASDITGIVSGAMEDVNPEASATLSWISLATGLAGMTISIGGGTKKILSYNGDYNVAKASGKSIIRDIEGLRLGPSNEARFNVLSPEIRPISEAPSNVWHEVTSLNSGRIIFGADRPITGYHIREPLIRLAHRNSNRGVVILTGSHGNPLGNNWSIKKSIFRKIKKEKTIRREDIIENNFAEEDLEYIRKEYSGNRPVVLANMNKMNLNVFYTIIDDHSAHIILAYCFGRNDQALRNYLNLPPVTSYWLC